MKGLQMSPEGIMILFPLTASLSALACIIIWFTLIQF